MSMEHDSIRAKSSFKRRANDIRDQLHFCSGDQKMTAVNLHCTDAYGVLLYDLQSEYASSLFKQCSVQARLAHGVRMETHTRVVLTSYMQIRYDKSYSKFNITKDQCDKFIDSLCIS